MANVIYVRCPDAATKQALDAAARAAGKSTSQWALTALQAVAAEQRSAEAKVTRHDLNTASAAIERVKARMGG